MGNYASSLKRQQLRRQAHERELMMMQSKKTKTFFVGSESLDNAEDDDSPYEDGHAGGHAEDVNANDDSIMNGVQGSSKSHRKHYVSPHVSTDRDSLLNNVTKLPRSTFHGLGNLAGIILFSSTLQLVLNNYYARGILVDFGPLLCILPDVSVAFIIYTYMCAIAIIVFVAVSLYIKEYIAYTSLMATYVVVQVVIITLNIRAAFVSNLSPLASMGMTLFVLVIHLKLHSYVVTNTILNSLIREKFSKMQAESLKRMLRRNSSMYHDGNSIAEDAVDLGRLEAFPNNVTFSDFVYFLCIPSLVYEPAYPKRSTIRMGYAIKELVAFVLCMLCVYVLSMQFILPALHDDVNVYVDQLNYIRAQSALTTEYWSVSKQLSQSWKLLAKSTYEVLHLSVPSIVIWLTSFYAMFHCWLNFLSEITCYADRMFYDDWWNSATLDEFWRKWNLLTHEWLHRHVFLEGLKYGRSKVRATLMTFLVSAVLHEYLFTLGFKSLEVYFALAMLVQVPLILLSRVIPSARWGNVLMWLSLFTGQPMLELLYVRQYALENPGSLDFQGVCESGDIWGRAWAAISI